MSYAFRPNSHISKSRWRDHAFLLGLFTQRPWQDAARFYKSRRRVDASRAEKDRDRDTRVKGISLRLLADDYSPIDRKQPKAVTQVPRGRDDAEHIYKEDGIALKLASDYRKCLIGMTRHGRRVKPGDHAKTKIQNMKYQEEEKERAGYPLHEVKPISRITVTGHVRPRFSRDDDAVDRVIRERNKYAEYLYEEKIRDIVDILDVLIKNSRPAQRRRVRVHVNEKKHAERNNARQLVQLSQ